MFFRNFLRNHDSLRVISYINIRLSHFWFSLWKDIFNHRNISCVSFFNCASIYFLINIYSDLFQIALKYLKDTKANINNMLIIIGDFNIRNNIWDSLFPHHSSHCNTLTCYNSKSLRLDNKMKTCIRVLIQENSIENSVLNCLPYILNSHGLCYYYFSLS